MEMPVAWQQQRGHCVGSDPPRKASVGHTMAREHRHSGHERERVCITGHQHCHGTSVCTLEERHEICLFPTSILFGRRQLLSSKNVECLLFEG